MKNVEHLGILVDASYPVLYVVSHEEDRVEGLLKEVSSTLQPKPKLFIWNPFQGLMENHTGIENSVHPLEALDKVSVGKVVVNRLPPMVPVYGV